MLFQVGNDTLVNLDEEPGREEGLFSDLFEKG